jgi:hypothetical protein
MLILLINTVQSKLGVSITPVTKLKLIGIASPHHINHPAKTRVGTFFLEQGETPTPPFDEMGGHPSKQNDPERIQPNRVWRKLRMSTAHTSVSSPVNSEQKQNYQQHFQLYKSRNLNTAIMRHQTIFHPSVLTL